MRRLLGERLHYDWKVVTITVASTLLLIVSYYHRLTPSRGLDQTILYLLVPLALIILVFRENPKEYGMTLGDWKAGVALTLLSILLIAPVLWLVARGGTMQSYYEKQVSGLPWNTFLDLFGWEFLFRGLLLFGYTRRFGPEGIWLQAVPFALMHLSKPEVETLSTIFGGFAFGWIAYRTRSFLYPFLIHWFVASFTILAAGGVIG
ncbi:MAG: lysostaphin resistance A-like protein [Bacteroidota bacterium]